MKIFFIVTLLFSAIALADDNAIKEDFQSHQRTLVQALINHSYQRVGQIDVHKLLEQIERINVDVVERVAHKQKSGPFIWQRDSAEWTHGKINVARRWTKTPPEAKSMVGLHESLGAAGYTDDDFSCSSVIWILTNDDAERILTRQERMRFEQAATAVCKAAGGTTGVGGGGDEFNATSKIRLMKNSLRQMQVAHSSTERDQALDRLGSALSSSFEINRTGKIGAEFGPNAKHTKQCLDYEPVRSSIRVLDMNKNIPIPNDAANGWTYDASSRCVIFHGKAIWTGYGMGPGVFATRSR